MKPSYINADQTVCSKFFFRGHTDNLTNILQCHMDATHVAAVASPSSVNKALKRIQKCDKAIKK